MTAAGPPAKPEVGRSTSLPDFILASGSPRRLELLRRIGIEPAAVLPADVDEAPRRHELPAQLAGRLAEAKASAVAEGHSNTFVLGADTVVACGRRVLPKAEDAATARRCLEFLSGRRHRVISGVCLIAPGGRIGRRRVTTQVTFKRLTDNEVEAYLAGGEWKGKAGGYAIQGAAEAFVRQINGSYSNVVGLPLYETVSLLRGLGAVRDG